MSVAKEHALDDLVDFISKRLEVLEYHNDRYANLIEDFEVIKGSMDDVFLAVTGKELKENIWKEKLKSYFI